jgi:hypothetical protein
MIDNSLREAVGAVIPAQAGVIPAQAGIQNSPLDLDSRFRGNDERGCEPRTSNIEPRT